MARNTKSIQRIFRKNRQTHVRAAACAETHPDPEVLLPHLLGSQQTHKWGVQDSTACKKP